MIEPPVKDWAYGITTVPSRRSTLFSRTLASLKEAGFDRPHLFVDGEPDPSSWRHEFGLDVTAHYPKLNTTGNWITALWTLYLHHPMASRYALFQDDVVAVRNLRRYLDGCELKVGQYWNLYTAEDNDRPNLSGWHESVLVNPKTDDWWQVGRGALGIVLPRDGVLVLLAAKGTVRKPLEYELAHQRLDGMIVNSMNQSGWREMVHYPSLLQHSGQEGWTIGQPNPLSTMERHVVRPLARTFPGEAFDAETLLEKK